MTDYPKWAWSVMWPVVTRTRLC